MRRANRVTLFAIGAVAQRNPDAVEEGVFYLERNGTLYRIEITREP